MKKKQKKRNRIIRKAPAEDRGKMVRGLGGGTPPSKDK
jgi:hypothetical protein